MEDVRIKKGSLVSIEYLNDDTGCYEKDYGIVLKIVVNGRFIDAQCLWFSDNFKQEDYWIELDSLAEVISG